MIKNLKLIGSLSSWIHVISLLVFLTFSNVIYAQSKTTFIKARKGIAFTNSGKKIKFRFVKETENSFVLTTMNKTEVELEKFKIAQIDRRNGTKGMQYALSAIGGTTIIVMHTYYLNGFYTRGRSTYEGEILLASVFLSVITGTVGGLIGLSEKKYKTIYTSPTFGNYKSKLNLKTTSPNLIPSLTLSYTF